MTIFEFVEQHCDIIAGEDGYYNYSKQEILDLAKDMKTSAEEWDDLQDARMSADANYADDAREEYYRLCDVCPLTKLEKES